MELRLAELIERLRRVEAERLGLRQRASVDRHVRYLHVLLHAGILAVHIFIGAADLLNRSTWVVLICVKPHLIRESLL